MQDNKVNARKGEINIIKEQKMCKLGDYCSKRILYWFGIGFELLSACMVAEVCQASKVFLMPRKEPLSITVELSKSMRWSNAHACFAKFDPGNIYS